MADYDLTTLDETKPDGAVDQVLVLDDAEKETRRKLKAFVDVEHDLTSGAHTLYSGTTPPAAPTPYQLWFNQITGELLVYNTDVYKWVTVEQSTYNYLYNTSFSRYPNVTSLPVGWYKYGTSTNAAIGVSGSGLTDTHQKFGQFALSVSSGNGEMHVYQYVGLAGSRYAPIDYWIGRTVSFGCWVFSNTAGKVRVIVDSVSSGAGGGDSPFHPGDSTWRWLVGTVKVPASTTGLACTLRVEGAGVTAYFSGPTLVEGTWCSRVVPSSWYLRSYLLHFGSPNGNVDTVPNGTIYYGPQGANANPFLACANMAFHALLSNLRIYVSNGAGVGQTVTGRVWYNNVDTAIAASIVDTNTFNFDNANKQEVFLADYVSLKVTCSVSALVSVIRATILVEEIPEHLA